MKPAPTKTFSNSGRIIPPTEFTQSIATWKSAFADSLHINQLQCQYTVNMLLIVSIVFTIAAQMVYISKFKLFSLSDTKNFISFFLIQKLSFSFSSFRAFHCLGLWLAVRIIPPHAPSIVTASSVVGVEAKPMFTTSNPIPIRVPHTTFFTISPEMRASRPTTILLLFTVVVLRISVA